MDWFLYENDLRRERVNSYMDLRGSQGITASETK